MMNKSKTKTHRLMYRIFVGTGLVIAGAIAVTWAWNTIVPDLTGLSRFRFAEGLAIAILMLIMGALFSAGRHPFSGDGHEPSQ